MTDSTEVRLQVAEEFIEIILEGVEHPNLRRMLEYVVRKGDVQRACHLKEVFQAMSMRTIDG